MIAESTVMAADKTLGKKGKSQSRKDLKKGSLR
jgi:hypothetical protein